VKNTYEEHPWLKDYPVKPEHKHLIIGTHPPMPYTGCMAFYYGNMNEFWRLLEAAFQHSIFFYEQGRPDLNRILNWLNQHNVAITDMLQYTIAGNEFNTDQGMLVKSYEQFNKQLKGWLENGNIETIFFTSFSQGNSALGLFKKWLRQTYRIKISSGKEIIEKGNSQYIEINQRMIRLVMLYSPSPMARLGVSRSQPFLKWRGDKPLEKGMIDEFRVGWYREYFTKII
jgi:hypothetical protein